MILGSLEKEGGINIKDLVLKEPQKRMGLLYDIRDLITSDHLNRLENLPPSNKFDVIDDFYKGLLILFPDKFSIKSIKAATVIEKFNENFDQRSEEVLSQQERKDKITQATNIKFLFPNTNLLNTTDWEHIQHSLTSLMLVGRIRAAEFSTILDLFLDYAYYTKIIYPDKAKALSLDTPQIWKECTKQLEMDKHDNRWWHFIKIAAQMKTLSPEKMSQFQIKNEDWMGIKNYFQEDIHPSALMPWVEVAADILFLQSDEIKITSNEIQVILPKSNFRFTEATPTLPKIRKF